VLLTLYVARKKGEATWLKDDDRLDILLQGKVDAAYTIMRTTWRLNKPELFGPNFKPQDEEIHVLVELPTDLVAVKRQKVRHDTSLVELWTRSELQLAALPAPHQLAELLQKPLPFKLTLLDSVVAGRVFNRDGPLLSCPTLTLLMNSFLFLCDSPPETTAFMARVL
jgi:hypothetical protein